MYLCYVDESGFSGIKYDSKQPVQVMAGVLVNLYHFHKSDNDFKKIFSIIKNDIPVKEIKGAEIYRGKKSWRSISPDRRDKVIEFYLNWLVKRNHKIILSIIDNKKYFDEKNNTSSKYKKYIDTLQYPWLTSAFHIALVIQSLNRKQKKNKGKTLLIFDEEDLFADLLQELIYDPPQFADEFVSFDSRKEQHRLNQIIDSAYFVKSHHSSIAQVSDIIAFLFKTFVELKSGYRKESYSGQIEKLETWIKKIDNNLVSFSKVYPIRKNSLFINFLNEIKPSEIRW